MADHFFGITDTGKIRDNNEDTFITQAIPEGSLVLACVIDGVGGYSGGEVAADIARKSILARFESPATEFIAAMRDAFVQASEQIDAEKTRQSQYQNMACVLTLAIVDIQKNQFYYAHLGDTRLYLFRDNTLVKVSKDHSFVGFLEESGRLTEEAAMLHPKRNEINKALGLGVKFSASDDYIETGESPFLPGDMLLLCSDGLTDMVNSQDITNILLSEGSLEEKGTKLIAAANRNGGKDNITVVLVKNYKAAQQQPATHPAGIAENKLVQPIRDVTPLTEPPATVVKSAAETKVTEPARQNKSNPGLVRILTIASLLLLATTLILTWLYLRSDDVKTKIATNVDDTFSTGARNEQEVKLQEAINTLKGDTLLISAANFPLPIIISDTLLIQSDSLYIKTEGSISFKAGESYSGPAVMLAASCNYISMENLSFENFDTGISVYNKALHLKNVKFNNCRVSIQNAFTFADNQYVNGRILSGSFKKESSPQSSQQ